MGCDIHVHVEKRTTRGWERVEERSKSPYYDEDPENEPEFTWERWYAGRNYGLFSVLAGVRGSFTPIAAPRGVPEDASADVRDQDEYWGPDGHSHSWFSLAELCAHDWKGSDAWEFLQEWAAPGPQGWASLMLKMQRVRLNDGLSAEDVRVVFWFDN
jgi:hypothetical protein